jgi:hypothetical protein
METKWFRFRNASLPFITHDLAGYLENDLTANNHKLDRHVSCCFTKNYITQANKTFSANIRQGVWLQGLSENATFQSEL